MLSNQVLKKHIEEMKEITGVDFCIADPEGDVLATTFSYPGKGEEIAQFARSQADSQMIGQSLMIKIYLEAEILYIAIIRSTSADGYTMGKVLACQIRDLETAYRQKFDRNGFFQNLLLDNMLLVDIFHRAKKHHIKVEQARIVFLIETYSDSDDMVMDVLKGMFAEESGDYVTSVEKSGMVLIKALDRKSGYKAAHKIAESIVDTMNMEAMINVRVSYGTIAEELTSVSMSYKEAKMAMDVGKIFYAHLPVVAYSRLGIGRLIYQLPINLCKLYMHEIFGEEIPEDFDEETLSIINQFYDNNLNISETARNLFIHRNTLVYRLDKLQKVTGLDIRTFEDALTLKIALMVVNYMKYLEKQ